MTLINFIMKSTSEMQNKSEIQNRKNELVLSAISRMESALKGLADDYFGN